MRIYLDASVVWKLYWPEKNSSNLVLILNIKDFNLMTSVISIVEISRAIKKRKNQNEITQNDALNLLFFFLNDIQVLNANRKIILKPIKEKDCYSSPFMIMDYNLYGIEALHLNTAKRYKCDKIIVNDRHFSRFKIIEDIQTVNANLEEEKFLKCLLND